MVPFAAVFAETGEVYETHAPMPTPRLELGVVALEEKIYAIGGFNLDGNEAIDVVEVYDTKTDTWTTVSPLPNKLHHLAAATYDGKIYVVGGYEYTLPLIHAWQGKNYLFIYDPTSDTWVRGADMPTERGALTAQFIDGKLYAVGGNNAMSRGIGSLIYEKITYPINEVYDPVTDSWEQKTRMPTPRDHTASAVIDGKLYVIGGREALDRGKSYSVNEVYDPKSDTWSILEPLPTKRSGFTASVLNNTIFVFGGETDERVFNENLQYVPGEGWIRHANMTIPRHGLGSATVGDKIYLIGGNPDLIGKPISLTESYYNPNVIPEFNEVMILLLFSLLFFVLMFRAPFMKTFIKIRNYY